jgi:adenylate kinase
MIIVLLGAPGAGKGTQAEILSDRLEIPHIASGDLLRENIKRGTPLGKLADQYMSRGELVPDEVVINMISTRLAAPDTAQGIILDGFPRTVPQAEALATTLAPDGRRVDRVFYVKVSTETLLDRLSGRWICRTCGASYHEKFNQPAVPCVCDVCRGELYQRNDDRRDVAENRLDVYFRDTLPVIDYYDRHGALIEIDGEQAIAQVTADFLAALNCIESLSGADLAMEGTAA